VEFGRDKDARTTAQIGDVDIGRAYTSPIVVRVALRTIFERDERRVRTAQEVRAVGVTYLGHEGRAKRCKVRILLKIRVAVLSQV